jgi:hypothetical protein
MVKLMYVKHFGYGTVSGTDFVQNAAIKQKHDDLLKEERSRKLKQKLSEEKKKVQEKKKIEAENRRLREIQTKKKTEEIAKVRKEEVEKILANLENIVVICKRPISKHGNVTCNTRYTAKKGGMVEELFRKIYVNHLKLTSMTYLIIRHEDDCPSCFKRSHEHSEEISAFRSELHPIEPIPFINL